MSSKVIALAVGDRAVFTRDQQPAIERLRPPYPAEPQEPKSHDGSVPWQQLLSAAEDHRIRLREAFLGVVRWISPINILVKDLERVLVLDLTKGASERLTGHCPIHIAAHSAALFDWFGKPFGADAFWVGADFAVISDDTMPVHRMMLAGLLMENRLAVKDVVRMILSPAGWAFFLNRREEILAILLGRHFGAGDSRRRL